MMNCWHCNAELIWGGDDDTEEDIEVLRLPIEEYCMVTNLSCPTCSSMVLVYLPNDHEDHFIMENGNG